MYRVLGRWIVTVPSVIETKRWAASFVLLLLYLKVIWSGPFVIGGHIFGAMLWLTFAGTLAFLAFQLIKDYFTL